MLIVLSCTGEVLSHTPRKECLCPLRILSCVFQTSFLFSVFVALNLISDLDVIEVDDADTALIPRLNFPYIILESLQCVDLTFVDDHTIADETDRIVPVYFSYGHITTGNGTNFQDLKHFPYSDQAFHLLFYFGA